jgi:hypothetical protein
MIAHYAPPPSKSSEIVNEFKVGQFKTLEAAKLHVKKYGGDIYKEQDKELYWVLPVGSNGVITLGMTED